MKKAFMILIPLFLIIILFIIQDSFLKKDNIHIGFIAGLTGKYSVVGKSVKNGLLLAFSEKENKINGREVIFHIEDDKQDEVSNENVINQFIKNDVKLIVGNVTSSMTKQSIEIVNKYNDLLLISATAASSEFDDKDDNFLRIKESHTKKRLLSTVTYIKNLGYKKVIAIIDHNNFSYSNNYKVNFEKAFIEVGGEKIITTIDSNKPISEIENTIKKHNPDLLLFVTNAVDGARITQSLRLKGLKQQIMAAEWARVQTYITNGGKAVEGTFFDTEYDMDSKDKEYIKFITSYETQYKRKPVSYEISGYELGRILIEALEKTNDIKKVKEYILKKKIFRGVQGTIEFNKYGDVSRKYFITQVKNAKFTKVE